MSRPNQPGVVASRSAMSPTPASKCSRFAFTVPTTTRFPSTNFWLICVRRDRDLAAAAGDAGEDQDAVLVERLVHGLEHDQRRGARRLEHEIELPRGPRDLARVICLVLTYVAPIASTRSES